MDQKGIIAMLIIGVVAGWLASFIVGGGGLISYLIWGVLGSVLGGILLPKIGVKIDVGNAIVNQIVVATIGAIVLVLIGRMIF